MGKIRVAIAGIGNCASNFIQGIEYYRLNPQSVTGLTYKRSSEYDVANIQVVAAFDIAEGKVGKDVNTAIFATPNCTDVIVDMPPSDVIVQKGPILDGWDVHFKNHILLSNEPQCNVRTVLQKANPDILVIMLPTASENACYFYAKTALEMGISVINCIPVLLSHNSEIQQLAVKNNACVIGDDVKSQIGGTILHHCLMHLLEIRGVQIDNTYQINYAGNMDFINLMSRGVSKHKSKERGIKAGTSFEKNVSVNVSYIENQADTKTCKIHIAGKVYGGCPVRIETELVVTDSANASGVIVNAIRCIMISLKKKEYGILRVPSAFYMKSPQEQMPDELAYQEIQKLLEEEE